MLEGRRRGFPSPCSSPPWNCLELTQPIGRPGDPGEGTYSTKPRRRFQETFSQYASRIWPRINKIQGPSLLAELEQETCRLLRSERNPTGPTPLSPATAESERRCTGAAAAPRTATGKREIGIFSQCSTGGSGWDGESGWEPRGGIKIEPCRRKSRGVDPREISLPVRSCSQ